MSPRFAITAFPARRMIVIEAAGFFTLPDVAAFGVELRAAHGQLKLPPRQHLALCDMSEMRIQSQEVVAALGTVARDPDIRAARLAVVVGVSLARLQAKRIIACDRPSVAFFRGRAEAEAWLLTAARTTARYPRAPASPGWSHDRKNALALPNV